MTATLRAAIARILDNLKNHVDTALYEEPAQPAAPPPPPPVVETAAPEPAPFEEVEPFDVEAAPVDFEDPFAVPASEPSPDGHEELLANARAVVAALEAALERAREHERALAARLSR